MSTVPPPPPPPPPDGAAQIQSALQALGGAFVLLGNAILAIDSRSGGVLLDAGAPARGKGKKRKVAAPTHRQALARHRAPWPRRAETVGCVRMRRKTLTCPSPRRQVKDKADRKPRAPSAYNNFVKAEGSKLQAEGKTQQVFRTAVSLCGLASWLSLSCPSSAALQNFALSGCDA